MLSHIWEKLDSSFFVLTQGQQQIWRSFYCFLVFIVSLHEKMECDANVLYNKCSLSIFTTKVPATLIYINFLLPSIKDMLNHFKFWQKYLVIHVVKMQIYE